MPPPAVDLDAIIVDLQALLNFLDALRNLPDPQPPQLKGLIKSLIATTKTKVDAL